MIQRPFFNLGRKARLPYPTLPADAPAKVREVPLPERVFLLCTDSVQGGGGLSVKLGDEVRTGQRLRLRSGAPGPLVTTVTGKISEVSILKRDFGKEWVRLAIDVSPREEQDIELSRIRKGGPPEQLFAFLEALPGMPPLSPLLGNGRPGRTLIISGIDEDLLMTTNQLILKTQPDALAEAMERLREIVRPDRVVLAVPPWLVPEAEKSGAEVSVVAPSYPNGNPRLIVKEVLKQVVPMKKPLEAAGVGFLGVDTLLALHPALTKGEIPTERTITVVNQATEAVHARVRVGTPVRTVLQSLNVEPGQGDRLVMGGPMTGRAIYDDLQPILFDTGGIYLQDRSRVVPAADTHCLNCGECVRTCPARIPVNMLIRLLENRLYQDAVDDCDLLYCIECGLCSYVCPARIPIFHYIALGKYEFAQQMEEAAHA